MPWSIAAHIYAMILLESCRKRMNRDLEKILKESEAYRSPLHFIIFSWERRPDFLMSFSPSATLPRRS